MEEPVKILALAGSTREDSSNKKLIRIAATACEEAGAIVTLVDLADYPMPIYDGDLEEKEGIPPNGKLIKQMMIEHDGFLLACPEYNSSITGVLKNAIDWASRPEESDPYYLVAYKGKTAALLSASPGGLGGLRALVHVRDILGNIGMHVMPDQVSISDAYNAFENGKLKNPKKMDSIRQLVNQLVQTTRHIRN